MNILNDHNCCNGYGANQKRAIAEVRKFFFFKCLTITKRTNIKYCLKLCMVWRNKGTTMCKSNRNITQHNNRKHKVLRNYSRLHRITTTSEKKEKKKRSLILMGI